MSVRFLAFLSLRCVPLNVAKQPSESPVGRPDNGTFKSKWTSGLWKPGISET